MAFNSSVIILVISLSVSYAAGKTYWTTTDFNNSGVLHKLVLPDIAMCLGDARHSSANSMIHMVSDIRRCSRKHLYHCVKSKIDNDVEAEKYWKVLFDRNVHCGKVILRPRAAVSRGLETHILIRGTKGFILYINMLLFDFEWCSLGCRSHGMGITDSADDKTVWFCGRRIPWTMVLKGNEVLIQFQFAHGKQKKTMFFYNKLKANWVKYYTVNVHSHPKTLNYFYNFQLLSHVDVFRMRYYKIFVIARPIEVIRVYGPTMEPDVVLTFYDGPGHLSQQINLHQHTYFTTSGFRAFFTVFIQLSRDLTLHLQVKARGRDELKHTCVHGGSGSNIMIRADVPEGAGLVCFVFFKFQGSSLRLRIYKFHFAGPTMLDGLRDLDDCQYGGLFIENKRKTVSICTDRIQHYIFHDGASLPLVFIVYKGYSSGYIHADVQTDNCRTIHLDLENPVFIHHQIKMHSSDVCCRVMCPSLNYDSQLCNITFKVPERTIGAARVELKMQNTLYACIGQSDYSNQTYTASALYSNEWPFTRLKHDNKSKRLQHDSNTFLNLYEYNISIPYVCQNKTHFNQFGVTLRRSSCTIDKLKRPAIRLIPMGNESIFEMTKECMSVVYKAELERTSTFLYFKTKTRHTGVKLFVYYNNKCMKICKKYTYVLKVWSRSDNEIRSSSGLVGEYSTPALFTGYYNDGFILQVIPPQNPCPRFTGCAINVLYTDPEYAIGTRNSTRFLNENQLMQIYKRR